MVVLQVMDRIREAGWGRTRQGGGRMRQVLSGRPNLSHASLLPPNICLQTVWQATLLDLPPSFPPLLSSALTHSLIVPVPPHTHSFTTPAPSPCLPHHPSAPLFIPFGTLAFPFTPASHRAYMSPSHSSLPLSSVPLSFISSSRPPPPMLADPLCPRRLPTPPTTLHTSSSSPLQLQDLTLYYLPCVVAFPFSIMSLIYVCIFCLWNLWLNNTAVTSPFSVFPLPLLFIRLPFFILPHIPSSFSLSFSCSLIPRSTIPLTEFPSYLLPIFPSLLRLFFLSSSFPVNLQSLQLLPSCFSLLLLDHSLPLSLLSGRPLSSLVLPLLSQFSHLLPVLPQLLPLFPTPCYTTTKAFPCILPHWTNWYSSWVVVRSCCQ